MCGHGNLDALHCAVVNFSSPADDAEMDLPADDVEMDPLTDTILIDVLRVNYYIDHTQRAVVFYALFAARQLVDLYELPS